MNIEQWLDQYGYWAVFCGVFVEGPLTLSLAAFLAHQGYLNAIAVFAVAGLATFLVVEVVYFIGLVAGGYLQARWPFWRRNTPRFLALFERFQAWFLLAFRFSAGSHTVIPMALGMSRIRPGYFSLMSALGAVIWTSVYFTLGYVFGHAFELLIEDFKRHELSIALGLIAIILVVYIVRHRLYRRRRAIPPA
jgi:membrane protein DedA with SNARE-associated domain